MELSVGSNIRKLLKDRNITQKELAETIAVSGGTLSDWINGVVYLYIVVENKKNKKLNFAIDKCCNVMYNIPEMGNNVSWTLFLIYCFS